MEIKFVYGIFPAFISYKEVDGDIKNYTSSCRIVIQQKYKNDKGIFQHELTHIKQWYRGGLFIHSIRYKNNRTYRIQCEVEAYRNQMQYPDRNGHYLMVEEASEKLLWDRYDLRITKEEAILLFLLGK